MKVFLDTNVLASAAATRGLCADVLREVLSSHELVISDQVLVELTRVLKAKFGVARDLIDDYVQLLREDAVLARPGPLPKVKLRDKDDLPILGAAVAGGAEVVVTGDKDLLDLGQVEDLQILSPRQFWERLKTRKHR
jgi:putative PIN family toxin of toxin-antitoxin system